MNLAEISVRRPVAITMAMAFLVAIGFIGLSRLPVDLYPNVSYPVLVVRADLSGAAPEEIEELITKRLEDTLSTLSGLKTLRSVSREGSSTVMMEFDADQDVRFQEIQVRGKVGNLRRSLPEEMSEPSIFRQDPDDTPIIELAVTGNRDLSEITKLAEDDMARKLRQISGVGSVDVNGGVTPEVIVDLYPEKIDQWQISPTNISTALQRFSRNLPAGKLRGDDRMWLVRTLGRAQDIFELGKIPVGLTPNKDPIFLKDVADVRWGFQERTRYVNFSDGKTLTPAVTLSILKQSGENTLKISDRVREAVEKLREDTPSDIKIYFTRDNADLVRSNVADVVESIVIGAILTVFVVLIFLRSPRSTLTTGLALPTSVITSFAIIAVAGLTINVMTLLALSLAVGLLVDDAIVVRENIFRHLEEGHKNPQEAAVFGAREVMLAVVATTLVIVAVFLPVGLMGGVSGQFFKPFALTVVFAVLVSLWDAATMAPMLSAYYANISNPSLEWAKWGRLGKSIDKQLLKVDHSFERVKDIYAKMLATILRKTWIAAAIGVGSLVIAGVSFYLLPKSFLPTQLGSAFQVSLSGPLAVPVEKIAVFAQDVQKALTTVKKLDTWTLSSGTSFSGQAQVNLTIRVDEKQASSQKELAAIRSDVRKALSGFPGYTTRLSEPADPLAGAGGGRFQPLAVMISGDELSTIREIAEKVRAIMLDLPGVTDIAPIQDEGLPEIRVEMDPLLAGRFNVSSQALGDQLAISLQGDTRNSLKVGDDQYPIRIKKAGGEFLSPRELLSQGLLLDNKAAMVPLTNFVDWSTGAGAAVISRENRQRNLRVGANLGQGAALGDILSKLEDKLAALPLPKGYETKIMGQNEQMSELFGSLGLALLIGCLFIYMILAALFESFVQPISVMAAIPLAATGAALALLITGCPLDIYGSIGMILLAGIVAKNSILLVDFASQKVREQNLDPVKAIEESAPLRLRPILMTSFAMVAGMVPVALGLGSGGAARMSLGIATIGGVISSTILTLLVVPSIFIVLSRLTTPRRQSQLP